MIVIDLHQIDLQKDWFAPVPCLALAPAPVVLSGWYSGANLIFLFCETNNSFIGLQQNVLD